MRAGCFVLALLMCYYADRTQMMAKGSNLWQTKDFMALSIAWIAVLIFTIRQPDSAQDSYSMRHVTDQPLLQPPDSLRDSTDQRSLPQSESFKDSTTQPFLSRDQIDEWKGWMQCLILTYHWTGAKDSPIDTFFHLCVCGYLFQVGYSHTLFYINKGDFSFSHIAATILRLDLLPCFLAYFMDTDYMFYYISPLLSFWFLVVYATMAISGKRNNDVQFLLAKICISCILISTILLATPLTHWTFHILKTILKVQWNGKEWQYHIAMNISIVYIVMLAAVMHREMKNAKITIHRGLRTSLALGGLLAIIHYLHVTPTLEKDAYEKWYPYLSAVPTLAFLALRNASTSVRNHHSEAMAWLGRCYLETYILQTHLLLAAGKNGTLIVDGLFGDGTLLGHPWRTLVVIVPIFLWISHAVADSTAYIVKMILHESVSGEKTWWLGRIPGCSNIKTPQIRIACVLLIMWSLNLMTPGHEIPTAPNGRHELSVVKNFPKQRHSLAPLNGTTW
ncbi:10 TM acyl transferase domain found in Cas1p-domain-containing protein [Fusarium flagelliforme]|uniref:10 TM acyl transferase domain found in Cas1p-domain-containing protein n=1 Tax=Fusarium flagelliforme TaxID=2675880 RepID=UPI001E8D7E8C|nr:10 TM acyl transferase domain found in Cas1p-domain-containing protein [Fusarium flagelliforme]KAH7179133.1 10 TM acyl transferase domain found in Cas1p-domain-containing protein [Fusarium flagelliforme]